MQALTHTVIAWYLIRTLSASIASITDIVWHVSSKVARHPIVLFSTAETILVCSYTGADVTVVDTAVYSYLSLCALCHAAVCSSTV